LEGADHIVPVCMCVCVCVCVRALVETLCSLELLQR